MANVFLIGFMGTGKSAVAEMLSKKLSYPFIEMDQEIEKIAGKAISDIFAEEGEEGFRQRETEFLYTTQGKERKIISCGGGVVLRQENIDFMKQQGEVILLTATPETIYQRIKASSHRPLLQNKMNPEYIEKLLKQRKRQYEKGATLTVATDGKSLESIVQEILDKMKITG